MAPSQRVPVLARVVAAVLLLQGASASLCKKPVSGVCENPDMCHFESFTSPSTGLRVEKCLECPSGSSIAWTGKNLSPVPKCIYSNVDATAACDPSFIAYTHRGQSTKAACYDQCASTGIYYGDDGNPMGCLPSEEDDGEPGSRRRLAKTWCKPPVDGVCDDPDMCHYESFTNPNTGMNVKKCLSCPNGKSIAWVGNNASKVPKCIYSALETLVAAGCDPSFIGYTRKGDRTSAACYDYCLTHANIAWDASGNPTGCKDDE